MPTWFERRILDLVGRLTDLYYRLKYGTIARRLGRGIVSDDDRQGFILVQIDGLSHSHLTQALDAGVMPHLQRRLSSSRLLVAPWRCGLPSSTPAVQAGMLFGNRFDIPGFRWYEKDRGTVMTPQRLDQVSTVRDRISRGQRGILRGGSCYVSMFDGDAELALFTLSTLRRQRFFESMRGVGLLVLFLLSPLRVLRILGLAATDYLTRLARRALALFRSLRAQLDARLRKLAPDRKAELDVRKPLNILSPLLHALTDVLFTEVQTFGVMLDIYRCVPAIYANYNGYDEIAHELGPDHPAAFRVLRSIDKRIHQIDRMRARYQRREYNFYLMSDHGNTPAVPFSRLNGSTLGQHLMSLIGKRASLDEYFERRPYASDRARYLREELRALEEDASPQFRKLLVAVGRYVDHYVRATGDRRHQDLMDGRPPVAYDTRRQKDVVVSASGPLAHIYFNVSPQPLDVIEVLLLYPQLVDELTTTPGIGAVIGRAGERTIVLGNEGGTLDIGSSPRIVEPPSPLAAFGDATYAARQIHRLAHFPHAGDLIVLGEMQEDGKVVTFESQAATHGGLGGPQGHPFIAWPPGQDLKPETLNDAEDLYPYFMRYHRRAD